MLILTQENQVVQIVLPGCIVTRKRLKIRNVHELYSTSIIDSHQSETKICHSSKVSFL